MLNENRAPVLIQSVKAIVCDNEKEYNTFNNRLYTYTFDAMKKNEADEKTKVIVYPLSFGIRNRPIGCFLSTKASNGLVVVSYGICAPNNYTGKYNNMHMQVSKKLALTQLRIMEQFATTDTFNKYVVNSPDIITQKPELKNLFAKFKTTNLTGIISNGNNALIGLVKSLPSWRSDRIRIGYSDDVPTTSYIFYYTLDEQYNRFISRSFKYFLNEEKK